MKIESGGVKTLAVLAGSLPAPSGGAVAAADVPVGPGPAGPYTVAPQPAPGSRHYRTAADGAVLPDPACTPGATNPHVTPRRPCPARSARRAAGVLE